MTALYYMAVTHLDLPELTLCVQEDVLVKCFHRTSTGRDTLMFRTQFHTCALDGVSITLGKSDLDEAWRVCPIAHVIAYVHTVARST